MCVLPYSRGARQAGEYLTTGDEDGSNSCTMASPTLGKLEEYQPGEERFSAYMERVHIFFAANDVAAAKQVPVLLSVIGSQTYAILRDLLAPASPMATSLKAITDALTAHFEPKSLTIVERYHFHKRS